MWDAKDRAKHLFIKLQYPDLDIRLVFSRAKAPINPGAATTCAEWATKHGFKYAEKLIPVEWMHEDGPKISPEEALRRGPVGYQEFLQQEKKRK